MDCNYLELQVRYGWLGCLHAVCDLRHCLSHGGNDNYCYFDGRCWFQIIAEEAPRAPI